MKQNLLFKHENKTLGPKQENRKAEEGRKNKVLHFLLSSRNYTEIEKNSLKFTRRRLGS